MANENPVEKVWDKVRGDNPEYANVSPDFRAKLQSAYADAKSGAPETGIAGLEEFEAEIRKSVKSDDSATIGAPSLSDNVAKQQQAEEAPKGSGAQDSVKGQQAKAEQDAAGAGARVEHDEVHSPSFPSAARPLAAEAPGSAAAPTATPEESGTSKKSGARKSGSRKAGAKKAAKK